MLLLVTFLSTGSVEQTPDVEVVQIKAPDFYQHVDSLMPKSTFDYDRTKKNCEMMGQIYAASLAGKLDSSTQVVITCVGEYLIHESSSQ